MTAADRADHEHSRGRAQRPRRWSSTTWPWGCWRRAVIVRSSSALGSANWARDPASSHGTGDRQSGRSRRHAPDVIHAPSSAGSGDSAVALPLPRQRFYVCHDWDAWVDAPPRSPMVRRWVAVDEALPRPADCPPRHLADSRSHDPECDRSDSIPNTRPITAAASPRASRSATT